jgi:ABC-2 type transport system permease protein
MGILLLTVAPAITMRLFSAEYNGRTIELLMTLPLRKWEIVIGKYLGAVFVFLVMTLTTCINLIPLILYGNPDALSIVSGYVGFVLLGLACIAIGQFFFRAHREPNCGCARHVASPTWFLVCRSIQSLSTNCVPS